MIEQGITPNQIVFTSAMEACAEVRNIPGIFVYSREEILGSVYSLENACAVVAIENMSRDIQIFIYNINILFCLFILQLVVGASEFVRVQVHVCSY